MGESRRDGRSPRHVAPIGRGGGHFTVEGIVVESASAGLSGDRAIRIVHVVTSDDNDGGPF